MSKVNELVICRNNYTFPEEFECAIRDAVMLLLDAEYTMRIRYDDKGLGIVVIEFNPADATWGDRYPYWLLPEEFENVIWSE